MAGVDSSIVGAALVVNVALLFGLAFWVRRRIATSEDYLQDPTVRPAAPNELAKPS